MKTKWFAISALALSLGATTGTVAARAYAAPASPGFAGYQEGRWDEPPSEFNDARRQGFHEGIEAARRDFDNHRHKDADDHDAYKHPPGDRAAREDFREGFRRGYEKAKDHMKEEHHDHDMPHI